MQHSTDLPSHLAMTAASVVSTTRKNPPIPTSAASEEEDDRHLLLLRLRHLHQRQADRNRRKHHYHIAAKGNAVRRHRDPPTSIKHVLPLQDVAIGAARALDSPNPSPGGLIGTTSFSVLGPVGPTLAQESPMSQDSSLSTSRCYHTALVEFGPGGSGGEASENCSTSSGLSGAAISSWNKAHKSNDERWEAIWAARSRTGGLGPRNFRVLNKLGSRRTGTVFLVELCGTKFCFAMKVVNKKTLARRKMLPQAQMEKEILECLDHPFLPSLYAQFDTERHSCLVMEYCSSANLHALRQRQPRKCFSEQATRHYGAEILLALEYLHMLGIVYRGLKPENVSLKDDGHIMLSDFDLSLRCAVPLMPVSSSESALHRPESTAWCCVPLLVRGRSKKDERVAKQERAEISHQLIPELIAECGGSDAYLAPEIMKGERHGSAEDWWALGVLLYVLLFGKCPFNGTESRTTLLPFPETSSVSFAARDLIRGLLVKEPRQRIGFRRGATEVKQHPFFHGVNWAALIGSTTPADLP
ncbi:hypothetical protein HPP92_025039 [Vanilla planifolia]|uniref:non-specific serine/threonine protein kinase n=1 Tax=Vanilla planifolia TaxID=51239 RepID=A0A835PJV1_VANPL|nr:hypothetical protein HPP92_025039 [Vanilla planifolia]